MQFKNLPIKLICYEIWRIIIGYYTNWKSIITLIKWINLLTKLLLIISIISIVIIGFTYEYNYPNIIKIIYFKHNDYINTISNQDSFFKFSIYTIFSQLLLILITFLLIIWILKFRITYSIKSKDPNLKGICWHILLKPWSKKILSILSKIYRESPIPKIQFSDLINKIFELQKFPQNINQKQNIMETQSLSFMYHWDNDWDKYLHLFLKNFFPKAYKQHLIKKNTRYKEEENMKINPIVLKEINIQIKVSKFTTILGCNGSGKSTFLKAIINLLEKYSGKITWIGKDLRDISFKSFYKNVAYISQENLIQSKISVYDYVACGLIPSFSILKMNYSKDEPLVIKNLKKLEILHKKDQDMSSLSGGEKQKAIIARALTQQTQIIILDEPTTYLDINNQYMIMNLLKKLQIEENKTIIVILHDIQQAQQFSDEIILFNNGEVFDYGEVNRVLNQENIEKIFGINWN